MGGERCDLPWQYFVYEVRSTVDEVDELVSFRESTGSGFGKNEPSVDSDIENPAGTGDQQDFGIKFFLEDIFQPGSPRKIISGGAVRNTDFHGHSLSMMWIAGSAS